MMYYSGNSAVSPPPRHTLHSREIVSHDGAPSSKRPPRFPLQLLAWFIQELEVCLLTLIDLSLKLQGPRIKWLFLSDCPHSTSGSQKDGFAYGPSAATQRCQLTAAQVMAPITRASPHACCRGFRQDVWGQCWAITRTGAILWVTLGVTLGAGLTSKLGAFSSQHDNSKVNCIKAKGEGHAVSSRFKLSSSSSSSGD